MFEFTIGLIIIDEIRFIADKDQNNTNVFTNKKLIRIKDTKIGLNYLKIKRQRHKNWFKDR